MRRVLFTLPLLAGLAAAIVLTMPSVARAWDIHSLPDGYTIVGHIKNGDCTTYQIRGYAAAIDLSDCRPDFQEALDQFVEQTCPQAVCHSAPPVTTTAASSTAPVTTTSATTTTVPVTTTAVTTTDTVPTTTAATTTTVPPVTTTDTTPVTTTTTAPPVTTDTTTTTVAAPPAPPTVTQTVIVETTITDPAITSRLDLIEQRQVTDEARLTQLENPPVAGVAPLGEPKNVSPFVA